MKKSVYLLFGLWFGYALSRVGASEYDQIFDMLTGRDLKIAFTILAAIAVGFLGMQILKYTGMKTIEGRPVEVSRKTPRVWNWVGGAVFGVGWALSGACPGTVLPQLGDGRFLALFTLLGLVTGTFVYALLVEKRPYLDD